MVAQQVFWARVYGVNLQLFIKSLFDLESQRETLKKYLHDFFLNRINLQHQIHLLMKCLEPSLFQQLRIIIVNQPAQSIAFETLALL